MREADALKLISLDAFEVEPDGLTLEGLRWGQVVPEGSEPLPAEVVEALPADGWREFKVPTPDIGRLFGAPHAGGWALAHLSVLDILSAQPGPVRARPGRASRRRGLRLSCEVTRIGKDQLNHLPVTLTNTSADRWVADPDDGAHIRAFLIEPGKSPGGWIAFAGGGPLPDLPPGGEVSLHAEYSEEAPAPGDYQVAAALISLDLWMPPQDLVVF